ncbi:hypothetical protein M407DRAFT_21836 [Tulasnella calospora MUT 4182]|uniref:DUF221-domain-containing protein n=1 Tax=Tulasnella calospora MUT 4182 TaxID=1051891 RepID=A0A0C3M620_9AGAM|nr:hypothetical protein M407DRAFT_21836 [Tulasnella calospora MUT 4182]
MSDAQDALTDLFEQYNEKLSNVMPQAVGYNVVLFSAISLATVFAFNLLRPRNKIIYEPKVKYYEGEKRPPKIKEGFFDWLSPLINTKEPELLEKIGLDAVAFLRLLRLMRWLFLGVALLCCGVLIPIDFSYNSQHVQKNNRNFLNSLTIANVGGQWQLFVHVAMSYIITFIVLGFVYWHWREMIRLRHQWFRSEEYNKAFYARTLMITRVPKKIQSDEGLRQLLQSIQMPYPTTAVHIGRSVGQLPDLIEYHNQTVRDLETVLVRYLKGGRIGKTRPTITIGGFLGMGGEKKDAIDYYTAKLKKTEGAVEKWRAEIDKTKAQNYGFASLAAVPYAHIVAKTLSGKNLKGTNITLAPNPKDIIWSNITKGDVVLAKNRMIGWFILAVVCFFNTLPLLIIQLLANLAALSQYVPFLDNWLSTSPTTFSLVSGILPPTVSAIFGYVLPIIMRKLSKYQGALTRSRLDRAVVARYFAFLIISQLFVFSLIGVGFSTTARVAGLIKKHAGVNEYLNELKKLPGAIQSTYLEESNYWLTYFPLRGFLAVFDLAQLVNVVWMSIKTRLFGRTPRDIREWTQPPAFEFAIYFSNMLFMAAVSLVYAPLAPLVPLGAAVVFWVSSVVYKYQLMFVFVSKVESGGRLWNPAMNRLMFSLILMHALMTLTIGLQMGWRTYYWVSALPPIVIVVLFKLIFLRKFTDQFRWWIPNPEEIAASKVHSERADNKGGRLASRFGHPALHSDLFTPMLHAKMMPLLPQVYHGRLGTETKAMAEYSGQKMETQIAPGGIRIAGITEADLAYDLAQYQRDRGQQDWDNKSMSSSAMLTDAASTVGGRPAGYDAYMAQGPTRGAHEEFEMANMDGQPPDQTPLLPPGQGFAGQQQQLRPYPQSRSMTPAHSQDALTAPSYRQHTDASSTYSGVSGPAVHAEDPYYQGYNQAPGYGYGQHPQHQQYASSNYSQVERPYTPSRQASQDPYGGLAYGQQQQQQQQQPYYNNNTRRSGGW